MTGNKVRDLHRNLSMRRAQFQARDMVRDIRAKTGFFVMVNQIDAYPLEDGSGIVFTSYFDDEGAQRAGRDSVMVTFDADEPLDPDDETFDYAGWEHEFGEQFLRMIQ